MSLPNHTPQAGVPSESCTSRISSTAERNHKGPASPHPSVSALFRQAEHSRKRLDLVLSPGQRRLRLDHLGRLELLGHLRIGFERLAVLTFEKDLLERRTRTLSARLPRLGRIA